MTESVWFNALVADSVEPDAGMAAEYLRLWHGSLPESGVQEFLSVQTLPSKITRAFTLERFVHGLTRYGLEPLMDGSWRKPARTLTERDSVYAGAALLGRRPPDGRRGGREYVSTAPGIWADLDVDPEGGKFASPDAISRLVTALEAAGLGPHLEVATGSGGEHVYLRVTGGVSADVGERLGLGLRLWAEQASGVALDSVANADRILRLPGSVRIPKTGKGGPEALCRLLRTRDGAYEAEALAEAFRELLAEHDAGIREARERDSLERTLAGIQLADWFGMDLDRRGWSALFLLGHAERTFNELTSWAGILEPHGWRRAQDHNGNVKPPDEHGRIEWCRPGSGQHSERSMMTDYAPSPHVGSLLSASPQTGLRRLLDSELPCSKLRVHAELSHGGDVAAALWAWLEENRNA